MAAKSSSSIRRGFVDIQEGQVHYRIAGPAADHGKAPVVMFHGSPSSSLTLVPLMQSFAQSRMVIAPDTLGQGDSCAPATLDKEMPYFADAALRAIDGIGENQTFDLYGTHTGAAIAAQLAIAAPERVNKLILDGIIVTFPDWITEYVDHVDNSHLIDTNGTQFVAMWNNIRNVMLFWPPDKHDAEHLRPCALPTAEKLHDMVVDTLKGIRTSHVAYRAAILYPSKDRLPLIDVPTLVTCAPYDMLYDEMEPGAALIPGADMMPHPHDNPETHATPEEIEALAQMLTGWLDA